MYFAHIIKTVMAMTYFITICVTGFIRFQIFVLLHANGGWLPKYVGEGTILFMNWVDANCWLCNKKSIILQRMYSKILRSKLAREESSWSCTWPDIHFCRNASYKEVKMEDLSFIASSKYIQILTPPLLKSCTDNSYNKTNEMH